MAAARVRRLHHVPAWAALLATLAVSASILSSVGAPAQGRASSAPAPAPGTSAPVAFAPNVGQAGPGVRFLARNGAASLAVTATGATLTAGHHSAAPDVLSLSVEGADPAAPVTGVGSLPGVVNYYVGSDPSRWRAGVPTYSAATSRGVVPGVDVTWHGGGGGGGLEYDLTLAPGVDPATVRLDYSGAHSLTLDPAGGLSIQLASGKVDQGAPHLYQETGGVRRPVTGGLVLLGGDRVGYWAGAHDPALPLVIDPTLTYSTYLGGTGNDDSAGVAVDASGDAYTVGTSTSADFPQVPVGGIPGACASPCGTGFADDVIVSKLNPAGTALLWSTYLGGSTTDDGLAIAVGPGGDAFVTGFTHSDDFPRTGGALQTLFPGVQLAFVTRLTSAGALGYSTYLGGSAPGFVTAGQAIAVDAAGDAFVAGSTTSPSFPTQNPFQASSPGGTPTGFVSELDPTGSNLLYSTYLSGSSSEAVNGVATDGTDVYVTGRTQSSDFPATRGTLHGTAAAFVTKLNPTAGAAGLLYSVLLSGSGDDAGLGIALDPSGNAYVSGSTKSSDFPTTPGAFQSTATAGAPNAFVAKLDPSGATTLYSTLIGGNTGNAVGAAIAVDGTGDAFVAGTTSAGDFPTTPGAFQTGFHLGSGTDCLVGDGCDATLSELNPTGSSLLYSTYLGGGDDDRGLGIALGGGDVYISGATISADFPTTSGVVQPLPAGARDAFVTAFSVGVAPAVTLNPVNQTVTAGGTATFTAAATGTPTPTVQWLQSTDGGVTFTPIAGATSTTLTLTGVTTAQSGTRFEATFTNSVGTATTTAAVLTVTAPPTTHHPHRAPPPAAPPPPPPPPPAAPPPPPPAAPAPPAPAPAPPAPAPPAGAAPVGPGQGVLGTGGVHAPAPAAGGNQLAGQVPAGVSAATPSPSPCPTPSPAPIASSPTPCPTPSPSPAASGPAPSPAPGSRGQGAHAEPSPPITGFGDSLASPAEALPNIQAFLIDAVVAMAVVALIAFPSQLFNRTYLANQAVINAWWAQRLSAVRRVAPPGPPAVLQYGLVVVVGALLGAAVNPDTKLGLAMVGLALATLLSIPLRVVAGGLAEWRYRGTTPRPVSVPSGLLVSLACVVVSRTLFFRPGYLYGVVLDLRFPKESAEREGRAKAVQSLAILALGVAAWLLWVPVASAVRHGGGEPLAFLRDVLAVTVVSCILDRLFSLVPLQFLHGDVIWRWSRRGWAAVYAVVLFLFVAVLIRPEAAPGRKSGVPMATAAILVALFGALSLAFWRHFTMRAKK